MTHPQTQAQAELLAEIAALRRQAIRAAKRVQNQEAETLYLRVLALNEQAFAPGHPQIVRSLGDVMFIYGRQGRHAEIQPLVSRALAIAEAEPHPKNRGVLRSLDALASESRDRGDLAHAEQYHRQAVAARQRLLGPKHPRTLKSMAALAEVLEAKRDPQAEAERVARAKAKVAATRAMFERAIFGPGREGEYEKK